MTNRGPQILDFRESWLREISAYQDQVKSNQLFAQINENKMKSPVGSHFRPFKTKEIDATKISKKLTINEVVCAKPLQFIVNPYHAQQLKKKYVSKEASPILVEAGLGHVPIMQSDSTKQKRSSQTSKIIAKSANRTKIPKTSKKRTKIKLKVAKGGGEFHYENNENTNHRDAKFQSTDTQNNLLPAASPPKVIVNPYHAKSVLSQKDPIAVKTSTVFSANVSIPEAHTILKNIHRTLNSVKAESKLCDKHLEQARDVINANLKTKIEEILKTDTPSKSLVVGPIVAQRPSLLISQLSNSCAEQRQLDDIDANNNKDNETSLSDDDLADFIDDDGQSVSSTDTLAEYTGSPYLSDAEDEENVDTKAPSAEENTSSNANKPYTPECILMPSLFPHVPPYVTFSPHVGKAPVVPVELQQVLKFKVTASTPSIIRNVVRNSGLRSVKQNNHWMGTYDKFRKSVDFKEFRWYQKYNHIPGTYKIGRKDSLWRSLKKKIDKFGKKEFGFMRRSFVLPGDLSQLKRAWIKYTKQRTKWIIKPPASARGVGVRLVNKWKEIPQLDAVVIQKYVEKPLLINGTKFDLRLYVLLTSLDPLRIYLYNEGLVRFASVQYSDKMESIHDRCMHLTNYSINKSSENYVRNDDVNACSGHKWTLKSLWAYFQSKDIDARLVRGKIRNLIVRTIIACERGMDQVHRRTMETKNACFELLGFDVLLDENLTPWLMEVNLAPALHVDTPLDLYVKAPLVQTMCNTALYHVPPKLTKQQQKDILAQFNLSSPLCFDRRLYVTLLSEEESVKHRRFTSSTIKCREDFRLNIKPGVHPLVRTEKLKIHRRIQCGLEFVISFVEDLCFRRIHKNLAKHWSCIDEAWIFWGYYLDSILEELTPDDVRCLIIAEDELARSSALERIFPTSNSYKLLKFFDVTRYYNRLMDAWETRYATRREDGIRLLRKLCNKGVHLKVPPTTNTTLDDGPDSSDTETV